MPDYSHFRKIIIKHGFLPAEADDFINAKAPDGTTQDFTQVFNSAPFQSMLQSRLKWVVSVKKLGWSGQKIAASVRSYYALKAGRSPFDFLKIEYRPPVQMTDYAFAVKVRAKARISRMSKGKFGIRYTKPMQREWRPKEAPPAPSQ